MKGKSGFIHKTPLSAAVRSVRFAVRASGVRCLIVRFVSEDLTTTHISLMGFLRIRLLFHLLHRSRYKGVVLQ